MMIKLFQAIDAAALIGIACCMIVIMQRDYHRAHFIVRAVAATFGALAFAQAMWLAGPWLPSPAGLPWTRAALDVSLFLLAIARVLFPLPGAVTHEVVRNKLCRMIAA